MSLSHETYVRKLWKLFAVSLSRVYRLTETWIVHLQVQKAAAAAVARQAEAASAAKAATKEAAKEAERRAAAEAHRRAEAARKEQEARRRCGSEVSTLNMTGCEASPSLLSPGQAARCVL